MSFLDPTRLLSIQSHVVSGYVGNRAATFPLQLLGYDVDVINTVQFSNHTGYGHTNGHKTTAEQIDLVFQGLKTNGLCRWSRCLTGYIPGAEAVEAVGKEIRSLKSRAEEEGGGEQLLYLLDPVMGDIGKGLYVAQDVVPVYRSLLPLASIITPNQFETELLSETKITSFSTLYKALQVLHQEPYGVKHVVISSIPLPRRMVERMGLPGLPGGYSGLVRAGGGGEVDGVDDDEKVLVCFASTSASSSTSISTASTIQTYAYALPTIRGYYSGVGDLFSALVLGCFKRGGSSVSDSDGEGEGVGEGVGEAKEKETTEPREPKTDAEELDEAVGLALWGVQVVLLKTHQGTLTSARRSDRHEQQQPPYDNDDDDEGKNGTNRSGPPSCIPSDEELDIPAHADSQPSRRAQRMRLRELKIIQEREVLGRLGRVRGERWVGKRLDWEVLRGGE